MNTHYNAEEWAAETTVGRQVFNYNYRMLGREVQGWKLAKVVTMQESPDATERAYLWQSKSDPDREMVRVSITERHNWRSAQESLREQLDYSMRPAIPRGTKTLAQVGDVNYVGREAQTEIAAAISFTRGNVCVSVSSVGERNVDVSAIARTVDRALSAPPARREVEKGRVRAAPKVAAVEAEEAHVLVDNLGQAAPGGGWLKVIVPDGELRREGNTLIYASAQGGEKQVDVFIVPAN